MEAKDIKPIIAKNLSILRKQSGLTQAELAEKLNYSDKAVSRWEHGDTLPDINVLYQLCDFYGIDMNTLVSDDDEALEPSAQTPELKNSLGFRSCIFGLAVAVVWIVATIVFLYSGIIGQGEYYWMAFIWAIPASCGAVFITSYGMRLRVFKLVMGSVLIWALLTAVFLHFLLGGYLLWPIYLVGVPLQLICVMIFIMKKKIIM
ncbi:MAG: helix-turn-helix transcriptional regulator [Clostridia bacterium]|nr:helix-turn-helix transcriptional regulator [Clostridia bacterium]